MTPIHGIMEPVDEPLFDTIHTLAPRTTVGQRENLFAIPLGQMMKTNEGARPKDYLDTNLYLSGMLESSQEFLIKAIRCVFIGRGIPPAGGGILPVSSPFYADTLLRLVINRKIYWTGPAWKCADPVAMVLNADTLIAMGKHKGVDLIRSLRRQFDVPVPIERQMFFTVEATFAGKSWLQSAVHAPERLVVLLEGKMLRVYQ